MILIANSMNASKSVVLELWIVGEKKPRHVKPPFKPYFYSLVTMPGAVPVKKKMLSTLQERKLYKVEFNRTDTLSKWRARCLGYM